MGSYNNQQRIDAVLDRALKAVSLHCRRNVYAMQEYHR